MWDLQQITYIEKVEEFKSEVLQLNSSFLPENKVYTVNAIITSSFSLFSTGKYTVIGVFL